MKAIQHDDLCKIGQQLSTGSMQYFLYHINNCKQCKIKLMYKRNQQYITGFEVNESYEAETIEEKIRRITNNNEPITDGAPLIYTERNEGVKPEFDIRTDRWEIAVEAMDAVSKSYKAKREERHKPKENEQKNDSGAESIQGTDIQ